MEHSKEFNELVAEVKTRVREIDIDAVRALQAANAPFRFIDVREDCEWQRGHLPGAEHLGRGIIERDIVNAVPNKDEKIVLYCGGGFRSALAADNLQKMGYRNVLSMAGGWRGWVERGLPTK